MKKRYGSACLIIMGANPDFSTDDPDIFYTGNVPHSICLEVYAMADWMIHLAWLDHCPNVVVDARASGCKIICSSTGGTSEISGKNSIVIEEDEWDFRPLRLYEPPALDFTRKINNNYDTNIDMTYVASQYNKFLGEI